ncbi:MAG: hypothetical protein ABI663_07085 [Chryseolinea sp.]
MLRSQWISYLFNIAFAMSLAHAILPHSHPKEKSKDHKHATSHHHRDHKDAHSHSHDSKPSLPVFTHFSNADFIGSVKYTYHIKSLNVVMEYEQPVILSFALSFVTHQPSPIPHARDLPNKSLLSIRLLRAPPYSFA